MAFNSEIKSTSDCTQTAADRPAGLDEDIYQFEDDVSKDQDFTLSN